MGFPFLTFETGISANFDVRWNVVQPWRARQAHSRSNSPMTSHNLSAKQSRKVASKVHFRYILHILGKNEKNNQTPHWGRESGIQSSCPRLQHPWLVKSRHGLQILDTQMRFPSPSLNVQLDSINLFSNVVIDSNIPLKSLYLVQAT